MIWSMWYTNNLIANTDLIFIRKLHILNIDLEWMVLSGQFGWNNGLNRLLDLNLSKLFCRRFDQSLKLVHELLTNSVLVCQSRFIIDDLFFKHHQQLFLVLQSGLWGRALHRVKVAFSLGF